MGATAGNTLTITGSIVGSGSNQSVVIDGASGTGVVILNPTGTNTYTGSTGIVRGILRLGKTDALPTGTVLDVDITGSIADAATFDMAGFSQAVAALQDSASTSINGKVTNSGSNTVSTLTVNQATDTDFAGIIENGAATTGTIALVKSGAGMLILRGSNTYTGGSTVNQGGVTFGSLSAKPSSGTHAFVGAATTLGLGVSGSAGYFTSADIDNAFSGTMTGNLSNVTVTATTGVGIDTGAGDFAYASSIPGFTKGLLKSGANTLTLSGSNAYTGGTVIIGGILAAANNNALSTGTVDINTGAQRLVVNDGVTIANNINFNGGGASSRGVIENSGTGNAIVSGTVTISGVLAGGGHFAGSPTGGTLTLLGPIISSTNVVNRTGNVVLGGGGSYANLSVTGTTSLGAANGIATNATVDVATFGNSVLDLAGYNQSLVGITRTSVNGATIGNSGTNDSILTLTGSSTYAGTITNAVSGGTKKTAMAINSGGFLTYTGNYTGDTVTVSGTLAINSNGGDSFAPTSRSIIVNNGGLLQFTGDNKVQNDTVFTVNTGGTFDLNGKTDAIGYLAGGGDVTNVNNTLNIDMPAVGTGSNFSGTISGTSGLVFRGVGTGGPGTQILSGSNSYGNTTIQKGRVVAGNVNAFGAAGRIITLSGTAVAEFATDTTANAYVINLASSSVGTVEVNRANIGTNMTHTMGTATIGNGTLNVQGGASVTGTATLEFQGISLTAGGTGFGTATLNPTSANILVSGSITRPGTFANSLTLGGTSTGNVISGGISGALALTKSNSSTWTLSGTNTYSGLTT